MAATLTSTSKMIQHTFDWESLADDQPVGYDGAIGYGGAVGHGGAVGYEVESSKPTASHAIIDTTVHAATSPLAVPSKPATRSRRNSTASTSSPIPCSKQPPRRNRCEHVGGVMATVLSKYGLGVDDLLHAIDNLRMARNQTPSTSQP